MLPQLLLLVLLSSLQPGRLQEQGNTCNNTLLKNIDQNLVNLNSKISSYLKQSEQFRDQMEGNMSSLRADLSSLNDSVRNLSNLTHQLETIQGYVEQLLGPYTCGGTGGWRRAVYLDMTDPSTTCPSGWNMTGYSKRTCGRATDRYRTSDSVTFPVSGGEYSRVCGRIKAYQWGTPYAFHWYHYGDVTTIDSAYVDGVSVTHGSPRQHIWTFAVGTAEGNHWSYDACPCDSDLTIRIPPFVGDDYFCESGVNGPWDYLSRHYTLHPNDTLWDGEDCLSSSTCCSLHNPPYFVKQLPSPTTDDIEARICLRNRKALADVAVEQIDLYVQ